MTEQIRVHVPDRTDEGHLIAAGLSTLPRSYRLVELAAAELVVLSGAAGWTARLPTVACPVAVYLPAAEQLVPFGDRHLMVGTGIAMHPTVAHVSTATTAMADPVLVDITSTVRPDPDSLARALPAQLALARTLVGEVAVDSFTRSAGYYLLIAHLARSPRTHLQLSASITSVARGTHMSILSLDERWTLDSRDPATAAPVDIVRLTATGEHRHMPIYESSLRAWLRRVHEVITSGPRERPAADAAFDDLAAASALFAAPVRQS